MRGISPVWGTICITMEKKTIMVSMADMLTVTFSPEATGSRKAHLRKIF